MKTLLTLAALLAAACAAPAPPPAPDAGTITSDAGSSAPADPCAAVEATADDPSAYSRVGECLASAAPVATRQAAIDVFLANVNARGGFPIHDGDDLLFAARSNRPLAVAGDFTGWQPTLALADAGLGLRLARHTVPRGQRTSGLPYKLVDGTRYFADPLARRFQYDDQGEFSYAAAPAAASHLERAGPVSSARITPRPLYVYVPAGYDADPSLRLPVLYMHDGQNLFDPAAPDSAPASWDVDEVADAEIAAGRVRPLLIVGVPNSPDRFDEYTWTPDAIDGTTYGGRGDAYADFLVHVVKPLVDARYRTLPDRDHTAILGSSLGGLISYEVALAYPDVYSRVGGMSSTFGWGRMERSNPTALDRYRSATSLAGRDLRFYLDSGGSTAGCPASGSDNACETLEMKSILEAKGFTRYPADPSADVITPADANILHWLEPGAEHSEAAWHDRLLRVLRFFFPR